MKNLAKRVKLKSRQTTLEREALVSRYRLWQFTPSPEALLYISLLLAFTTGFLVRRLHINWKKLPRVGLNYSFPALSLFRFGG